MHKKEEDDMKPISWEGFDIPKPSKLPKSTHSNFFKQEKEDMIGSSYVVFDSDIQILESQYQLHPELREFEYLVSIKMPNKFFRYVHVNNPYDAEQLIKWLNAKILWIKKL